MITGQVIGMENVRVYFGALPDYLRQRLVPAMDDIGNKVASYVQQNELSGQILNRRTGRLSNSITHTAPIDTGETVSTKVGSFAQVPYARPLEYGAAPHTIVPVKASVLAFQKDGKTVFARKVNHPGNRAYAYLRLGLEANAAAIVADLRAAVSGALP